MLQVMKMFQHLNLFYFGYVLTTCCFVKITGDSIKEWFQKIESTEGETASMLTAISVRHCSFSCLQDKNCMAYKYSADHQENCVLIHKTKQNNISFVSNIQNQLYKKVSISEMWSPPADWTSTNLPAAYRSFDNDKYVELENGVQFVTGRVNKAISTNNAQKQWVSLGNLSVACFTIVDTCGSAGGALSAWIKIGATDYPTGGIISSFDYSGGFQVFVYNNALRYQVFFRTGFIRVSFPTVPTEWYYLVFNYIGQNNAEGIAIYHDGVEVGSSTEKTSHTTNLVFSKWGGFHLIG